MTVNAVDANWNVVPTIGDTIGISSSDTNAVLQSSAALSGGTQIFSVTFKTSGSRTVTATDLTDGTKLPITSSFVPVTAAAFVKLQLLAPGETVAPGTTTGKSGTPNTQTVAIGYSVTVNAVDANWNVVTSVSDVIGLNSTEATATLPSNTASVSGTKTLSVSNNTVGTWTVTASDVTDGTKLASTSPSITVNPGPFARLQVLAPGETALPGSATGKTGAALPQTAGAAFSVTVNAVDAGWNPVNTNDTVTISSSDTNAILPASAALIGGTKTLSVTLKTAGTSTLTASNVTHTAISADTSTALNVSAGVFAKLLLLTPGETAVPGSITGKAGTPTAQTSANAFNLTVNAVDANWNLVTSATDSVAIASSDSSALLPTNAPLTAGAKTFSLTLKTAGSANVTATDITDGTKSANSSTVTVNPGAFVKLQVLAPGEISAPATATGKTGTPTSQTAGTAFNVTVNAVDANWNVVNTNDTVSITSTDANAALPANGALLSGSKVVSVTLKTVGSAAITASDVTNPTVTSNTTPAINVAVGAFAKLQILTPGETSSPGSATR